MRLPFQQGHVQVAAGAPLALSHVLQPRGHEHEGAPPVREGSDHAGSPADLAVQPLDGVVGAYAPPVLAGEPGDARVSAQPSLTTLATSLSLASSRSTATSSALASTTSRDSMAWTA